MTATTRNGTGVTAALVRLDDVVFHTHNVRHDLGDLRPLTQSIRRHGILVPIIVERWTGTHRIRAGHRRVAAGRIAGLTRAPAIVHPVALDDDQWLIQSIQENEHREQLEHGERVRAIRRLLDHGHTRTEIADIFGVADATIGRWLNTGPRRITSETRRNYTQLTAPKVRGLVADWRIRDATAATILDELDQLFAPKDG
jgi:ParB/RepB/Spo0J family partition protein